MNGYCGFSFSEEGSEVCSFSFSGHKESTEESSRPGEQRQRVNQSSMIYVGVDIWGG